MAYIIDTDPALTTLYVARPLELPPRAAETAFDAHRSAAPVDRAGRPCLVDTRTARLHVLESGLVPRHGAASALRRTRARLGSPGRLGNLTVDLEVSPWSDRRCEIGIRPLGRAVPLSDGHRTQRYFAIAVVAVEHLVQDIERRAEAEVSVSLLPRPPKIDGGAE